MTGAPDRAHVPLAELVAALSLGVDLGFGQPMEHVLRQCLIALRMAERIGLDDEQRAVVYYAALLVSVGCHSDAHEQAKWFATAYEQWDGRGWAVEAVLGAAGHRVRRRREGPAGLTAREVEVLRLLARGLSNREIAQRLTIAPKTVGNHVEHIYAKIGASTRARASLFALQHGLLPEEELAQA